mmetsp:Transcript_6855/g.15535  ORF Transcript_6855/g.15535 Transcript_6855/m.15535 type:complete len:388 (+) Transcript_6855:290-1453(+)
MANPQERMEVEYNGMMQGENLRLLPRRESLRRMDHPVLLRRSSSSFHEPRHHYRLQTNDPRISEARSFEDEISERNLPPPYYYPNDSMILAARSFDDDAIRTPNDLLYDPAFENGLGLPPRPPRRYNSHQPIHPYSKYATAPRCPTTDPRVIRSTRGLSYSPKRGNGEYLYPRHTEVDRSGGFPRAGDRPFQPRPQLQRSSSVSVISPKTRDAPLSRSMSLRENSGKSLERTSGKSLVDSKTGKNRFSPQRSVSIDRRFETKKVTLDVRADVWVERIIVEAATGRKSTYFKSVHGKVVCKEPPTGAKTIVYLEDIIEDRQAKATRKKKSFQQKKLQTQPLQEQPQPREQKLQNKSPLSKESSEDTGDKTVKMKTSKKKSEKKTKITT